MCPDSPKTISKHKESALQTSSLSNTTSTIQRKSQSPVLISQQQQNQSHQTFQQQSSNKALEKANIISSQIISPTTGKYILSKASGGPSLPIGSESGLVITSKGNVYTNTSKISTVQSSNKSIDSGRNTQTSMQTSSITTESVSTSATASSLSRRLSRQGTTLQALTGDRMSHKQSIIEEPPKVIIQQKTIVDEICSPPPPPPSVQEMTVQLEPGEISASEAAELQSRFGFIEVQQVQSPSPPTGTQKIVTTTKLPVKHTQQHKTISRKIKNKLEETSSPVSRFNSAEVPPLVALSNDGQSQQQHQQLSRTSVKRKHVSSPQVMQQGVQTINKPQKPVQPVQPMQLSANSPSTSTVIPSPSSERLIANSPGASSSSTSANLSKKINDNQKLLAVPGESFGGPPGSFYLCTSEKEGYVPVDNIPLFLDANNQLIPLQTDSKAILDDGTIALQAEAIVDETGEGEQILPITDLSQLEEGNQFLINTEDGQQIILDQQSLLALAANGGDATHFITVDGQQLIVTPDVLTAVNQTGDLGSILLSDADGQITTSNPDILAAALAGTEVYHQDQLLQIDNGGGVLQIETSNGVQIVEQGITFQPINPPVTAQTNETNAILTQPPIMSTLEVPSSKKKTKIDPSSASKTNETGLIGQNLDDSLAVIGVTTQSSAVPSSLNLPITVTNPAIAPKTTSNPITLTGIYPTALSGQSSQISPTLSSIANEQELVGGGYELFTTSTIVSQHEQEQQEQIGQGSIITEQQIVHEEGEEIVMEDFSNNEQSQHQIPTGNYNSACNR